MSHNLLDQCVEAAVGRGMNMSAEYAPWIPVDLFQTLLVDVHEYAGCSWLTAIDSQLKSRLFTFCTLISLYAMHVCICPTICSTGYDRCAPASGFVLCCCP